MSKKALSIRNEQLSKEVQDMPETSDREKENLLRKRGLLAGMLVIKDGELIFH